MEIYRRYGPALVRKARRMLASEADALDVVHGLFIDLLQKGTHDVDLPYLYRAVTRRCLNLLRDERNRAHLLAAERPSLHGSSVPAPDAVSLGQRALRLLGARVSEEVMETLVYRHCDDMGLEEIAEIMGVSRKTVGIRLKQADAAMNEMRARGEA